MFVVLCPVRRQLPREVVCNKIRSFERPFHRVLRDARGLPRLLLLVCSSLTLMAKSPKGGGEYSPAAKSLMLGTTCGGREQMLKY